MITEIMKILSLSFTSVEVKIEEERCRRVTTTPHFGALWVQLSLCILFEPQSSSKGDHSFIKRNCSSRYKEGVASLFYTDDDRTDFEKRIISILPSRRCIAFDVEILPYVSIS
ncbi:hypothetical protein PoB_001991000 [Plakobranchus ocellatus]|uniref:Uncharacterized protein n=1 Tax=Plakobranchus ocellatus TaxID=259542 RepID=A0AAV3ZE36_9GAST|nr:hypothetical protein PoB_001991000 [Plakobranchus ocellatus]